MVAAGGILLSPVARLSSDLLLTRVRMSWNGRGNEWTGKREKGKGRKRRETRWFLMEGLENQNYVIAYMVMHYLKGGREFIY